MTLAEHLRELRSRLVKSGLAVAVGVVASYLLWEHLFAFLIHPYCQIKVGQDAGCKLFTFQPLDQFLIRLRVSVIAGTVVAAPVWLYQLGAFITPGLKRAERRWAGGFLSVSLVLFVAGCVFAYLTISRGLAFLLQVGGPDIQPLLGVTPYLNFVTLTLVAFGVSFEFPVVVVFLNLVGVFPLERMRVWRRGMIFALFVFAALVTPSQDPFTFTFMALPLCLMYEGCIVIARVRARSQRRRAAAEGTADLGDDEISPLSDRPSGMETGVASGVASGAKSGVAQPGPLGPASVDPRSSPPD